MSWNYRVCSYTVDGQTLYAIREVYYHADGNVKGVGAALTGDWTTPDDVRETLDRMRSGCNLPVLSIDSLLDTDERRDRQSGFV